MMILVEMNKMILVEMIMILLIGTFDDHGKTPRLTLSLEPLGQLTDLQKRSRLKVFWGGTVPYSLFSSSRPPVQKKGWLSPDSRAIKCSVFSALSKDTIAIFLD